MNWVMPAEGMLLSTRSFPLPQFPTERRLLLVLTLSERSIALRSPLPCWHGPSRQDPTEMRRAEHDASQKRSRDRSRHAGAQAAKPSSVVDCRNRGGPGRERSGSLVATEPPSPGESSQRGYRLTLRVIGTARPCWRRRLKVAADDPEALRLSARSAARQNRDQQAIAIYSRLELRLMTAEDYFLLGRSLSRTGQDDLALKALEASRDAEPDRLEMLDELAQVYFRKDRPAAAPAIAERLIHQPRREARSQLYLTRP